METLAIGIAGVISPFVAQWVKNKVGWSRVGGLIIAGVVSFVTAIAAAFLGGFDFSGTDFTVVFTTATAVYHLIIKEA